MPESANSCRPESAAAWIGTSGWSYPHWDTRFYSDGQPAHEHLPFYARHFSTVELNNSYYRLPARTTFESWRTATPDGFLFAVKASRYLTHMKLLKEPEEPLLRLLDNAAGLAEKLGPVLFQSPRRWQVNLARLAAFLDALQAHPQQSCAFEFRHVSWLTDAVYRLLHDANAALCLPIGWGTPVDMQLTATWTYLRFHGGEHGVAFEDAELARWADRIRNWRARGIVSYSYFNNDSLWNSRPAAIDTARRLRELVGGATELPYLGI